MQVTVETLARIAGASPNANMQSTILGLQMAGVGAGLERPHRLAMFLGQLAHESGGWRHDREIWGPTAAQQRYDTRTDLGNTAAKDGDGYLYRGRGPIQITGKSNYGQFTAWARKLSADAPDFVRNPDAVNTDPWEGLGPIWYWDTRNLNRYADAGDFETVTRRINGGTNGLADRQARYARAALALMHRDPSGLKQYQAAVGLKADGILGPITMASLHKTLLSMDPVRFADAARPAPKPTPAPARGTPAGGGVIAIVFAAIAAVAAFIGLR